MSRSAICLRSGEELPVPSNILQYNEEGWGRAVLCQHWFAAALSMSLVVCTKLFFFFSPLPNMICLFCGIRCSVSKLSPLWPSFWFSTMERLKLVLQYFQSNSESISNGICIILALVSVKLYTSFDFNCPCLPQYNKLYSLGVMIVPPVILFFFGVLINRHAGVMMDEWMRPVGNRSKNPVVVKWVSVLIACLFFFFSLYTLLQCLYLQNIFAYHFHMVLYVIINIF